MDIQLSRALMSGIMFGSWPLILVRSNLSPSLSTPIFAGVVFICTFLMSISEVDDKGLSLANFQWLLLAGLVGGLGMNMYTTMLSESTSNDIGNLMVLNVVIQIAIPAIFHAYMNTYMNENLPITKFIGLALALIGCILMIKN